MRIARTAGPVATAALFVFGFAIMAWVFAGTEAFYRPVTFLFSGKVFADRPIVTGGALDQPSLHKGFFLFCFFSVIGGLLVVAVRWLGDRRRKAVRRLLCVLSLLTFLQPLSVLTITFYDLLRYMHAMGFTPARIAGLVFGLAGYAAVFAFVIWASELLPLWPKHWTGVDQRGFEVQNISDRGPGDGTVLH